MNKRERIAQIMPVPSAPIERGSPDRWGPVEALVRTALPDDYKWFINTYGSGYIGSFMYLCNPFSQKTYMHLTTAFDILTAILSVINSFDPEFPYSIFPKPNGLFPFGATKNGDNLCWITTGHPNEWPLFILEARTTNFDEYKGTIVDFIIDLLENKPHGKQIPSDLIDFEKLFDQNI